MSDGVTVNWVELASHATNLDTHIEFARQTSDGFNILRTSLVDATGDDDASRTIHDIVLPMLNGFTEISDGIGDGIFTMRDGIFAAADSWRQTEASITDNLRLHRNPGNGG
jgi:hypothetical protein